MFNAAQLSLLASCISIGVEGAEAPQEDIDAVEAVVAMIEEMLPIVEENGVGFLRLLGPNEITLSHFAMRSLLGDEIRIPEANLPVAEEFAAHLAEDYAELEAPPTVN